MNAQKGFIAISVIFKALGRLLDAIPPIIYLGFILAVTLATCAERAKFNDEKTAHQITTSDFTQYRERVHKDAADRQTAARQETERQREIERFRTKAASEIQNAFRTEIERTRVAVAARAAAVSVREQAIARASSPDARNGGGGYDPTAAARIDTRTATLGRLLATCRREGDQDARDLEELAALVRGLKAQYQSLRVLQSFATSQALPED